MLGDLHGFFGDGGPAELAALADRLLALGAADAAARTWTLLGTVEWTRANREDAVRHLDRALAVFDELPDSAEKASAYANLARLRMTDYDCEKAIAAARTAAAMARRLGLLEIEANALVTEGSARYISGDPDGLNLLEDAVALCRKEHLRALRRAALNLGVALQEEGDIARSYALADESAAQVIGDASAATLDFSEEADRAYFAGDWARTLRAADEYLSKAEPESSSWEVLSLRAVCSGLRTLTGDVDGVDIDRCVEEARRGGFRPVLAQALAHGALCHALSGRPAEAIEHLRQLLGEDMAEAMTSREWLPAAAHAASVVCGERCAALKELLAAAPRPTMWVRAALATVEGGIAVHAGRPGEAAAHFVEAVGVYDRMGNLTDATLAATWAARAWQLAGDHSAAAEFTDRVASFARQNSAPGLLALLRARRD